MHTTKDVPITSISSTFQIRESTDEKHVQEIVRSIQEDGWKPGEYLDVIQPDPDQEKFKLADGNHRLQALKLLGWTEAPIRIIGSTDLDLYKQAYKVNAGHGVRLTRAEKEHFIKEMLKLYCGVLNRWSLARFVEEFEISKPTAIKYKNDLESRGFEFPETVIKADGKEFPAKFSDKKSNSKILPLETNSPEQEPDPKTGMIFCANKCGTPTYPENLEAEGSTWIQKEGHWFCSEDCAEEWEQNRLSDEAERLTGISDKLPANPTAKLPTKPNPINYPSCPAIPVKTDSRAVSGDVLEDFTDADEPENVLYLEISKNDDEQTIAGKISQIFDFFSLPNNININNIINILINKYNLNIIIGGNEKKSKSKRNKKQEPLPEEEKTGLIWKLNDGSDWELPKSDFEEFKRIYPAIDVESVLRKSIGWSFANPQNRKTASRILAHLNVFLGKEQCSAPPVKKQYPNYRKSGYVSRDAGLDFENLEY